MTDIGLQPQVRLTALVEGVPLPVLRAKGTFSVNQPGVIELTVPYVPQLEIIAHSVTKASGDSKTEDGLTIVNDFDIYGTQPDTVVQLFAYDEYYKINYLIQEGRQVGPVYAHHVNSPPHHTVTLTAICSGNYMYECYRYILDRGNSLGLTGNDWEGRLATMSYSDFAGILRDKGISQGIIELLKNAGSNGTLRLNILWRLMRLERRMQLVDNPKALGYFEGSRLDKILEKTIDKMNGTVPIAQLILTLLRLLDYRFLNVPAPAWIDAKYGATGSVADVALQNAGEVEVGDLIFMPDVGQIAPPPRCNVIFPCDYDEYLTGQNFSNTPSRMISRISGRGALQGGSDAETTLILPDEVADGIQQEGRYFNSPQEIYSGIHHVTSTLNRPEYVDDMGSDYVKNYLTMQFWKEQHNQILTVSSRFLNLKPVPGFPFLILSKNGQHKIGRLEQLSFTYVAGGQCATVYGLNGVRPYDVEITESEGGVWLEHQFFAQQHIGAYLYPKLLGPFYESGEVTGGEEDAPAEDLSILAHLNDDPDIPVDELEERKSDPGAIKTCVEMLYDEYRKTASQVMYARLYGMRTPITKKNWLQHFHKCVMSEDGDIALGGYSIQTNSVTLVGGGENAVAAGEKISDNDEIAGCYYKERQSAYFAAYEFFKQHAGSPIDISFLTDGLYIPPLTDEEIMQTMNEMRRDLMTRIPTS